MTHFRSTAYGFLETPVGKVMVTVRSTGVAAIDFLSNGSKDDAHASLARRGVVPSHEEPVLSGIAEELERYFAGDLTTFTLLTDLTGVSDFTRNVLAATAEIPYGETRTYGEIARTIGRPGATQAVGNALGANPVPIIIPCHRVVRGDGSMGWYTGGQEIKRTLLSLEGVHFPMQQTLEI